MFAAPTPSGKRIVGTVTLLLPLLLLLLLRLTPEWDIPAWNLTWYTHLFHYYAVSFTSFMALVAALFVGAALGAKAKPHTLFISHAFCALALLLLLGSIATPELLIPGLNNEAFRWSTRLSLLTGGIFFALAGIRWGAKMESHLATHRRLLWLAGGIVYVLFVVIAFGFPAPLEYLTTFDPAIKYVIAAASTTLLLWAAWRAWSRYRQEGEPIEKQLAIALVLLAEAQICQILGVWGRLSWLLYDPLILSALIVTLSAILGTFRTTRHLQPARYFAALGSILIVGLSLLSGEAARWLASAVQRRFVVSLSLAQGALSFLIMYVIVLRLERLITERTRALLREQQLRSELTQLIVHDLKSPLTVITGGINLLSQGHLGSLTETQVNLLTQLELSGQNILNMINDLLDVERLEAGALTLRKVRLDTAALLKEQVSDLQIVASTHKQNLALSLPDRLPTVRVDKELMRRVVNNILANALKFTPEGGKIRVSAHVNDTHLIISVADNGPGVPRDEREHIFEKFKQGKDTGRRGAGLGLTFCKMVVETHGGALTVDDSPQGGALFEIALPLEATAESSDLVPGILLLNNHGQVNSFG